MLNVHIIFIFVSRTPKWYMLVYICSHVYIYSIQSGPWLFHVCSSRDTLLLQLIMFTVVLIIVKYQAVSNSGYHHVVDQSL
jgi:hypothetical protein